MQRAALENMQKVLKAAGSGLEHIVKANVYLRHMDRDFGPMNEIYIQVNKFAIIVAFSETRIVLRERQDACQDVRRRCQPSSRRGRGD